MVYAFGSSEKASNTTADNYGQYDKGTPMCDKGAYGDVNGLCKQLNSQRLTNLRAQCSASYALFDFCGIIIPHYRGGLDDSKR